MVRSLVYWNDSYYDYSMRILNHTKTNPKPCCAMLRLHRTPSASLQTPAACAELLTCLAKDCVMMQQVGASRVKVDEQYKQCYLLVDPTTTREMLNQISETVTLKGLNDYYPILNQIEASLAKNPLLKEIVDHHTLLLSTLREGERKWGIVPQTIEKQVTHSPELSATQAFLQDHPRLADKPQFDGVAPSQTPIANDNPSAIEQVNRLQHQHQPKPAFNPRPQM